MFPMMCEILKLGIAIMNLLIIKSIWISLNYKMVWQEDHYNKIIYFYQKKNQAIFLTPFPRNRLVCPKLRLLYIEVIIVLEDSG